MPDDDEPIIIDTRRGKDAPRRPRRRPAEDPQQIPVRSASPGRGPVGQAPPPAGDSGYDSTRVMPTRPGGYPQDLGPASRQGGSQQGRPGAPGGPGNPGGPNGPGRPYGPGGPAPQGRPPGATRPPRRKRTWLRVLVVLAVIVALWAGLLVWAGLSAWGKVHKVDAFPGGDRPAGGKGTNVLLVGSDSRVGMSNAEAEKLRTGGARVGGGTARTDSIMLLHMPDSGKPTLVSLQRDSWVAIPGHGRQKINAAFTYGGPKLLVQTVEQATGLRIDNYMEIGFGGFAGVVDSVGGVRMCLPEAVKDDYAHIDLPKGCQNLKGADALGYVRSRHAFATGDLARAQHQREFLGALMKKVASPTNLLLPWRLKSVGESGAQGVAVDQDMSPWRALKIMWTLKGITNGGQSVQVPVADANYFIGGESGVLWDQTRAKKLFEDLNNDRSVSVAR